MSVPFKVKALYEYKSEYTDDLQFAAGQEITVTEIEDDEWYSGTFGGSFGMFPKNFVEKLDAAEPTENEPSAAISSLRPESNIDVQDTSGLDSGEDAPANTEPMAAQSETKMPPTELVDGRETANDLEIGNLVRKNGAKLPEPADAPAASTAEESPRRCPPVPSPPPTKLSEAPPPRVPMPGSMSLHRDDSYTIKKQFIGAGKSSYVPQVKPRDNSNVSHGFNDVSENRQVVRETDDVPQAESNEPKMSLKERIAMLQKRQQEEAERETAALKKMEERKKKLEEEKKLKASQARIGLHAADDLGEIEQHHVDPHSAHSAEDQEARSAHVLPQQTSGTSFLFETSGAQNDAISSPDLVASHVEKNVPFELEEEEVTSNHDAAVSDSGQYEEEAVADEEDAEGEGEEEDDDEDLRRKRLVERMAKISGGRNMFGMMGMPGPFGNASASAPAPARPKPKRKNREAAPAESQDSPVEKAARVSMPIPGFVPTEPAPATDRASFETQTAHAPTHSDKSVACIVRDEEDCASEDSVEEEEEEERQVQSPEDAPLRGRTLVQTQDSELGPHVPNRDLDAESSSASSMNVVDESAQDVLNAGYEADADTLDRGVFPETDETAAQTSPEQAKAQLSAPPVPVPSVVPSSDGRDFYFSSVPPTPALNSRPPVPAFEQNLDIAHSPVPTQEAPVRQALLRHSTERTPLPVPPVPIGAAPDFTSKIPEQNAPAIPTRRPPPLPPAGHTDEHKSTSAKRPPPPVPSDMPALPHLAGCGIVEVLGEDSDHTSEEEMQVVDAQQDFQTGRTRTFSQDLHVHSPDAASHSSIRKSSTSSLRRNSFDITRRSSEIRRSGSYVDGRTSEQDQALLHSDAVKAELADLGLTRGWWIKGSIPYSLSNKLGVDLNFEVDEHKLHKRDGSEVIYKDYYILFHDLSQIVFEVQYQSDDPRDTVSVGSFKVKPFPKVRRDILHGYSSNLGQFIAEAAERAIGSKLGAGLVDDVFHKLKAQRGNVLHPIGEKAFGVTVYRNFNSHITKTDEVRPGDILCMKNAKFTSHKGLGGLGSKSITAGEGNEIYSAVVLAYDPKKDKVRVAENGKGGIVKRESYRFGEMKSGHVRIFRAVTRDIVGW